MDTKKAKLLRACQLKVGDKVVRPGEAFDAPSGLIKAHPGWFEVIKPSKPKTRDV